MRARILQALHGRGMNAHQLARALGVDYTTVRHHLHILVDHQIVERTGGSYATVYLLTDRLMELYPGVESLFEEAGKRQPLELTKPHRRPVRPVFVR